MNQTEMNVNGQPVTINVEPRRNLADFLREDRMLTGTHVGCEQGICGACTVVKDGSPIRSCLTWAVSCAGSTVESIENFDEDPLMVRLRHAFSIEHALQCGFCTPGMLITARDIVTRYSSRGASAYEIRKELSGNLCRCTGYQGIVRAIQRVLADGSTTVLPPQMAEVNAVTFPDLSSIAEARPASGKSGAATRSESTENGQRITSSFALEHGADEVWHVIQTDIAAVVSCLPGAELTELRDDGSVAGFFNVKLGPIGARIAGEGQVHYDEKNRQGHIQGHGKDSRSNSRASGALSFALSDAGAAKAQMTVSLEFEMTGSLAQFGRGGLVEEVIRVLIDQFRDNFNARLAGREPPKTHQLGLMRLVTLALRQWLTRFFSSK